MTLSRRSLCLGSALTAASLSLPLSTLLKAKTGSLSSECDINPEFIELRRVWIERGLGDPEQYISQCMRSHGCTQLGAQELKSLSILDFKAGQIFDIHGLRLSQFEAAVVATLGV